MRVTECHVRVTECHVRVTERHACVTECHVRVTERHACADETGARIGMDYERRSPDGWTKLLDENWGIGAMIDFDTKPVESVFVAVQFVYHPVESVGLVLAPGYSFIEDQSDSFILRLGSRYAFPLSEHFTISPEIFYDIGEGGYRKGILAIALGYGF